MDTRQLVDEVFERLLRHLLTHAPCTATELGDHRRDGELDDWGPEGADVRAREVADMERALATTDVSSSDVDDEGDRLLLADMLAGMRFQLEGLRVHERDPLFYLDLATGGVYELIRREDRDAAQRRDAVAGRATQVPRLLDQARANLTEIPAPHREVALLRAPGAVALFRDVLSGFAPAAAETAETAAAAVEDFAAWLEDGARNSSPDWRLGEERWADALRLALGVRMAPDEIWRRGEAALEELQAECEEHAAAVLGDEVAGRRGADLVRAGLAVASADRSERRAVVSDAADVLTEITAFLRRIELFDLPEPDVLRVEEVPPFQQGVAVAFFVPAPPLEPEAPHTYYLSPVPDDWDDDRAESFLREYNRHALRSVGIHEAYPGHYVQLAFAQRHPRLLRRALWNSAFAEGWAVYAERQVVGAGFGDAGLRLVSAKMDMRSVANALLDQGLHVHGWGDEQAMALMTDRAYQEEAEATGKLVRGKVTAGQLSTYFVGGEEMADLRRDAEAARGADFDARTFHRDVLSQGTPPFSVLRRALL